MLQLDDEFRKLAAAFTEAQVPFALCGGLAMAAHGFPRATIDIDFVVSATSIEAVKCIAIENGFDLPAAPMQLDGGNLLITRLTKVEKSDYLSVDFLTFIRAVEERISLELVDLDGVQVPVVTRASLVYLKQMRNNDQDRIDIANLTR